MAAEDLAVEQSTESGPGSDLPQGAASELNAALPTQTVSEGEMIEAPGAEGEAADLEMAEASDYEPMYVPEDDDDAFITGPTIRPDEPVTMGVTAASPRRLSPDLLRHLPDITAAAAMPGASATLKTVADFLVREASR